MKIYIPEVLVSVASDGTFPEDKTWLERVNYWNLFGYQARSGKIPKTNIDSLILNFGSIRGDRNNLVTRERYNYIPLSWAEELVNLNGPAEEQGEITGWEAVWRMSPATYAAKMPSGISYIDYVNESGQEVTRSWNQWGTQNHKHYYAPATNRYFIPTWSWGSNISATEMFIGDATTGLTLISRGVFNSLLNAEELEPVDIEPSI